jgi:nicotinamidase-related amidase
MQQSNSLVLQQSALLIIDMQEAFRASIPDFDQITRRTVIAVAGAKLLNLPIIVTEQYPKGLGHTVAEIANVLPEIEIKEKTAFSSCGAAGFLSDIESRSINQVLVAGIEAHICVNQTVHGLLASNIQVHILVDCISARKEQDKQAAFRKMELSGALPSSVEMALFELMRDARHEQFKAIQGLVK